MKILVLTLAPFVSYYLGWHFAEDISRIATKLKDKRRKANEEPTP